MKFVSFNKINQQTCRMITFCGLCWTDDLLEDENVDC